MKSICYVARTLLSGGVVLAGVKKVGWKGVEIVEASTCILALKICIAHGFHNIVVESDAFNLIKKIKRKIITIQPNQTIKHY